MSLRSLADSTAAASRAVPSSAAAAVLAVAQGLTLVHFSAQLKSLFLWCRGCVEGLFRGGVRGRQGVIGGV